MAAKKKPAKKAAAKKPPARKAARKTSAGKPAKPKPAKKRVVAREPAAGSKPPAKKPPSAGEVPLAPVKVVDKVPVFLTTEVRADIGDVERLIGRLVEMPTAAILKSLKDYSGRAAGFAGDAIKTSARALVCAWACGRMLLAAKGKMKRADFTAWCDTHVSGIMSVSTKQRYMRLAEKSGNVRELLAWRPTLRQAYIGIGILPEPEKGEDGEEAAPQTRLLLTTVAGMRKRLQRFADSRERLAEPARGQLQAARQELDTLFDRILD